MAHHKPAPRRTGEMKRQIVQWPFTRVWKQPVNKRRRGKGTRMGLMQIVLHTPPAA